MKASTRKAVEHGIGALLLALVVVLTLAAVAASTGCTGTIAPKEVTSHQASFDGNDLNSGILGTSSGGYQVTAHFRDRYVALVKTYGRDYKPALTTDAGLTAEPDGTYLIDKQHMVQFLEMNAWLRAGLSPINK